MKIIGINGSHRKGKNTAAMLSAVLESANEQGVHTELIELVDYDIGFCKACNACLGETKCSIRDDMDLIGDKLIDVDGIVFGSPVYWSNVTTVMKNFIDRSRWMHMKKNLLEGKVGAALTHAGLRNGGQEMTLLILENYIKGLGMIPADSRSQDGPIFNLGALGTMTGNFSNGKLRYYKSVHEDEMTMMLCKEIAGNMINLIQRLKD